MHRAPRSALLTLAAFASILGACAGNSASTAKANPGCPGGERDAMAGPKVAESSDEPRVKVVNAYCPIAGSHSIGEARTTVASLTRDFNGKKIGFCCEDCPPVWDHMSEADKTAALNAVLAKDGKRGS